MLLWKARVPCLKKSVVFRNLKRTAERILRQQWDLYVKVFFTGVIVFALILTAVMAFGVIFFIYIHKSSWTMVRLLGKSKGSAARMLMETSAATAAPAIVIGGLVSWRYGLKQASETMAGLREMTLTAGEVTDASAKTVAAVGEVSLPIYRLFVMCAGVIILWMVMMSVAVHMLGRRSLMQVMQGTAAKIKKAGKTEITDDLSEKLPIAEDSILIKPGNLRQHKVGNFRQFSRRRWYI